MTDAARASRARQKDADTEVGGIAADRLRSIVERIERLEEERKALANDIKDIYGEAKSRRLRREGAPHPDLAPQEGAGRGGGAGDPARPLPPRARHVTPTHNPCWHPALPIRPERNNAEQDCPLSR